LITAQNGYRNRCAVELNSVVAFAQKLQVICYMD